jgi:hypothetical protein
VVYAVTLIKVRGFPPCTNDVKVPGMASFASQQFSRLRRLAFVLGNQPHYVLGRFPIVRDVYSMLNAFSDAVVGSAPLRIGDLYDDPIAIVETAPSGHLLPIILPGRQVDQMRTQSYSLGPHLTIDAVSQLRSAASRLPLKASGIDSTTYGQLSASQELRDRIATATVRNSSALPVVRRLAGDPLLYEVVRQFLGYQPKRVSSWLFWSLANRLSDDQRRAVNQTIDFHFDVNGFNFVYANFYLFDTSALNGAHVLIAGTGRRKRLRDLIGVNRLSNSDARKLYGPDCERVMEGPAGFGFLEDASCYHKALPPRDGDRLMLQLRYQ